MQNLFFLMLHMKTTVKFLFSTLVAAAAMTSTAWAEGTAGKIAIGEVEYDSFQEVIDVVTSSESISSVKLQGDITEVLASDKEFIINGDLTITADSASKISLSNSGTSYDLVLNGNSSNDVREKLTIDENVALEVADRIVWAGFYGNNVDIQVDGTLRGNQLWIGADVTVGNTGKLESFGEAFVLRRGATVDVEGKAAQGASETERTCQIRANYFSLLSGYVNVKNTLVEGGALWIANTGSYTNEGSVWISMDNTVWKSTGNLQMNTDATALIEVDNGSVLTVGLHDGGQGSFIGKNSDLWISDASILNTNKITVEGCVDLYDATWNAVGTVTNNAVIDVREGSLLNASQTSIVNNASGIITVESSTLRAGSFVNNGTFTVSGNSSLNIATLTGNNMIQVVGDTTLVDSTIGGNVAVGYGDYTDQPATLTLAGTSKIGGVLYVGDEKTVGAYKLNVTGNTTIGQLLSRTESVVNISNDANVSIGYWQNKGATTIDNASVEVTGVNFYVYNNDSDSLASITLKNGANLTATGLAKNVGLVLGNTEATPAKGHAALYLEGGSTVSLSELQLRPTVNGDKTYKIEVAAKEHSTIDVVDAVVVGSGATVSLTDSTLKATSVNGSGRIIGNGEVTLNVDSVTNTRLFFGRSYDEAGKKVLNDAEQTVVNLKSVTPGKTIQIKSGVFNFHNSTLNVVNGDCETDLKLDVDTGSAFYSSASTFNLNGGKMDVSGRFVFGGVVFTNGTYTVDMAGKTGPTSCFQVWGDQPEGVLGDTILNTIAEDATFIVNNGPFGFYADTLIEGTFKASKISGSINLGANDTVYDIVDKATVTVSGELMTDGSLVVNKYDTDVLNADKDAKYQKGVLESELIVKDGGTVSVGTTLTNNGTVKVENGTLSAKTIQNNSANFFVNGDSVLEFETISGNGSSRVLFGYEQDGSTASATKGTLTLDGGSVTAGRVAMLNGIKLSKDLTINISHETTYGGSAGIVRFGDGELDLNGHTLTVNGQFVASTERIKNGTIVVDGTKAPSGIKNLCFQRYGNVVESSAVVLANDVSQTTFYGSTTVNGKVQVDYTTSGNATIVGGGFDSTTYASGSHLTVAGEGASYTQNGRDLKIYGIWGKHIEKVSSLTVSGGATFTLKDGKITNDGLINVGAGSTLTANAITGSGDVVLAGTIKVVGGVFKADDLTIVAGATLKFGAATEGVTLMATREVISFDFNTLTIVTDNEVAVDDTLDLSSVFTESGADELWNALANKGESTEFTVIDSAGNTFTAVYSSENGGTVTVIPEPSMFGLFAGLGALLLVGTRRRRR